MRSIIGSILAATALLVANATHAQTRDAGAAPGATSQPVGAGAKEKEKDKLLGLLDDARSLSRWMPNEPSFLAVLDRVAGELSALEESQYEPLREFEPHFSDLAATLARIRERVGSVQAPTELCDPARRSELFLLFLDTLDAEGQRAVTARICEKLATLVETSESLSQVCVARDLALGAARSMRDLATLCDPTLERGQINGSADGFDQIRSDLEGMKTGVQESVRTAKRDLTQAMTIVAGHVSEVTMANTSSLQGTIEAGRDDALRLEIEKALEAGKTYGAFCLPQAHGGQLETVRSVVVATIQNVLSSGENPNSAADKLAAGDSQYTKGNYKKAFRLYSEAYAAAVKIAAEAP